MAASWSRCISRLHNNIYLFQCPRRFSTQNVRLFCSDNKGDKPPEDEEGIKLSKPKAIPLGKTPSVKKEFDASTVRAAEKVAEHLNVEGDEKAIQKTSKDLLNKLKKIHRESNAVKKHGEVAPPESSSKSMASLFGSMKIEKEGKAEKKEKEWVRPEITEEQKAFLERRRQMRQKAFRGQKGEDEVKDARSLIGKPFGIFEGFKDKTNDEDENLLKTWRKCHEREMQIISTPRPKNFLEEMIQMTEKGMLWHLPINNEQGIDEDQLDPFYKHIFFEEHLESWCPKTGPIRHFMELVVVGLSKNPYISVEKKISHINWFKEYFMSQDRREILEISGALRGIEGS